MAAEESLIQQEILDYLQRTGWFAWNNTTAGPVMKGRRVKNNARKGSPDIEALKNGLYLACEVKGPRAKLQEDQLAWLQRVVRHGGLAIVVGSLGDAMLDIEEKTTQRGENADIWIGKDIRFAGISLQERMGKSPA